MEVETLVVGGGLSGLSVASHLAARQDSFVLVEARDRLGGRVLTEWRQNGYFDLGPAWFWPGQPRIAELIARLKLRYFEQFCDGAFSFEDANGAIRRGQGYAPMQGSYRLEGGLGGLISALAGELRVEHVRLSSPVISLRRTGNGIDAVTEDRRIISSRQVVLALPPRIVSQIQFEPLLPPVTVDAMEAIPTWMAGQAKAVAVYSRPFWRIAGLSGDAISHCGPLAEIHDASTVDRSVFALFGFVGVEPKARLDEVRLRSLVLEQLARLFGPEAAKPSGFYLKDWARDPFTSTRLDQQPVHSHPHYGLPAAMTGLWDDRLFFCGTEVAPQFGGFLEGALEAARNVLALLERAKV